MDTQALIETIRTAPRQTPVKVYLKAKAPIAFPQATVFGVGDQIVFGDWADIRPVLEAHQSQIEAIEIESHCRNRALPLLDVKDLHARIEPGAIIREMVHIGDRAVIMMGAVINLGAVIGEDTMIDMNAVLGGRAMVGKRCHVGAGAVLAGVIEPASALPVIVGDDVLIGANAVVLEGVQIGSGAVVAAGAVVVKNVPPDAVVAGVPARFIKWKDAQTAAKSALVEALRNL